MRIVFLYVIECSKKGRLTIKRYLHFLENDAGMPSLLHPFKKGKKKD